MRTLLVVAAISSSTAIASADIDRSLINRVVKVHVREIRTCYERALKVHPALTGKVKVTFTIATDGKVRAATAEGLEDSLDRCIEAVVKTFEFPRSTSPATIVYPFLFAKG